MNLSGFPGMNLQTEETLKYSEFVQWAAGFPLSQVFTVSPFA